MKRVILFILSIIILIGVLLFSLDKSAGDSVVSTKPYEKLNVSKSLKEKSFNTPVIVIDTHGEEIGDKERTKSTMYFYENKENYLTDKPTQVYDATLKWRGNSSMQYPKKQYSVQFVDEKNKEVNESVLGLPEGSHFALNAPFADVSLLRNYIAYDIGGHIMQYSPKAKFCQVFLIQNGKNNVTKEEYEGVYLMIQKIKRSKDMVNIDKSQKNSAETSFIIEKDRYKAEDGEVDFDTYGKNTGEYKSDIINIYPKNGITKPQVNYINEYFSTFERALYSNDFENPKTGYAKYINVDSFVNYYIINEFFNNVDAGRYSTYFYKNYKGKMYAGPIWDFNISMGNNYYNGTYYDPTGFFMQTKSIYNRLLMSKSFDAKVIARYRELRKTYLSDGYLDNLIDEQVKYLGPAIQNNFERWPIFLCNQATMFDNEGSSIVPYEKNTKELEAYMKSHPYMLVPTTGKPDTYDGEIKALKNYIKQRGAWMDANIESIYKFAN
ncbi:MAG: CotH kinase family protein [Clostridium sp.]|uniref:CotH kinase family protein n=1 Tax=Clostridium sp. TaxID=1506 RepID=UPI003F3C9C7A